MPAAGGANINNLPITLTFTVQQLTATLVNPTPGTTPDPTTLNDRGYIDVQFTLPPYASSIDLTSMENLTPKFTVTVDNSADGTLTLDPTQAPVLISQSASTYTFRFFYTGTFQSGPLTLNFLGNTFNYLDSAGQPIPDFADETLPVQQDASGNLYINVNFGTSQTLNTARSRSRFRLRVTAITSAVHDHRDRGATVHSGADNHHR